MEKELDLGECDALWGGVAPTVDQPSPHIGARANEQHDALIMVAPCLSIDILKRRTQRTPLLNHNELAVLVRLALCPARAQADVVLLPAK